MIKKCACGCGKEFEGRADRLYFSAKCRKDAEVLKRRAPKAPAKSKKNKPPTKPLPSHNDILVLSVATKPITLNPIAAAFWDKVSPLLIQRGHLNILSEDAFAELCDLHSRLVDIRTMIDSGTALECPACGEAIITPGNRSLLQIDDKWSIKDGTQTQTFKESALSDLKRKYSARFLEYCKQFYLTPYSVRGNFGIEQDDEGDDLDKFMKGKNGR